MMTQEETNKKFITLMEKLGEQLNAKPDRDTVVFYFAKLPALFYCTKLEMEANLSVRTGREITIRFSKPTALHNDMTVAIINSGKSVNNLPTAKPRRRKKAAVLVRGNA